MRRKIDFQSEFWEIFMNYSLFNVKLKISNQKCLFGINVMKCLLISFQSFIILYIQNFNKKCPDCPLGLPLSKPVSLKNTLGKDNGKTTSAYKNIFLTLNKFN